MISEDDQARMRFYLRYGMFQTRSVLYQARFQHIRGQLDNEGDEDGAKALYLQSRVPQREIDGLQTSEEVQEVFGLERENQGEFLWQNRLAITRAVVSRSKVDARGRQGDRHP